jgi:cell division protein FtsB
MPGLLEILCLASTLSAAPPEPHATGPMTWRVVVLAENPKDHPAEFRTRFCRELRMSLETGFEKSLCAVDVVDITERSSDSDEPIWRNFRQRGWPALESETPRPIDAKKTHFVKLTKSGAAHKIEARQVDGFTGLLSPRLASRETNELELLSRIAGVMLAPEYGTTGIVIPTPNDAKTVRVRLQAGQHPGSGKLVQANDIFAVSMVTAKDGIEYGQVRPYTFLKALGPLVEGEVRCEVLSKYRQPIEERRGIAGFRCMKIATQASQLRVKILDMEGKAAPSNAPLDIWASDTFLSEPTPRDRFDTLGNVYISKRPLPKIACVVVKFGASRREAFVVPVGRTDDPPVELRMRIRPEDIAQAEFDQACEELTQKTAALAVGNVELYRVLGELISEGKNEAALQKATAGLATSDATEKTLREELGTLRANALAANEAATRLLNGCEKQLAQLRAERPELERKIADLKDAVTKANDPVRFEREFRAKELARQIAYHTGRGEIPTALELYEKLIELMPQADLPAKKAKLETEWKPVNSTHAAARKVLLEEWRKASTREEFASVIPKLQGMVAEFARNADKHGLRNFLASLPTATARLGELVHSLDESIPANRETLQKIKQWNDDVRKADEAANAALK